MNFMRIVIHNVGFDLTVARTGQNSRRQKWQLITRLPACAQLYFTFEFRGVTLLSTDYVICQHRCVLFLASCNHSILGRFNKFFNNMFMFSFPSDLSTSESGGRVSTNHCRVPRA